MLLKIEIGYDLSVMFSLVYHMSIASHPLSQKSSVYCLDMYVDTCEGDTRGGGFPAASIPGM